MLKLNTPILMLATLLTLHCVGCGDDDDAQSTSSPPDVGDIDGDGFTTEDGDCDDTDPDRYPNADERCDTLDNDCDSLVDEDATDAFTWYVDKDADGFGSPTEERLACDAPQGFANNDADCDDSDAGTNPDALEVCDEDDVDEDCSGSADDMDDGVDPSTQGVFYPDVDMDNDGASDDPGTLRCNAPEGFVTSHSDCNDDESTINSTALEVCDPNATDENCNGTADDLDSLTSEDTKLPFYPDADGDGFGQSGAEPILMCRATSTTSGNNTDCDDTNPFVNPSASEVCDEAKVDENCSGEANDEDPTVLASSQQRYYADEDGDSFGDANDVGVLVCERPVGKVAVNTDCDDTNPLISPAATEVCDPADVDENCNGNADDDDATTSADSRTLYYHDVDADGYGDVASSKLRCSDPSSSTDWWTQNSTDCNDRDKDIYPGAAEYCNSTDDDCDSWVDEDGVDGTTYYLDEDRDTYGVASTSIKACSRPTGYASVSGDCDDSEAGVNPAAKEVCDSDNVDENCNSVANDSDATTLSSSKITYFPDTDHDGYGDASSAGKGYCAAPEGYTLDHSDCLDSDEDYHPGAPESCSDSEDFNCDGTSGFKDGDKDGFAACEDCNDANAQINPGSIEICDASNIDENCNGKADDADSTTAASSKTRYYTDGDHDGFGRSSDAGVASCEPVTGKVANNTDCNDANASINPGALEVCDASSTDENCNGVSDDQDSSTAPSSKTPWHHDVDADGYGATTATRQSCDDPSTSLDWWTLDSTDCNDRNGDVHPGATETCNGTDDDCDSLTDESGSADAPTWYRDRDSDDYGTSTDKMISCSRPSGYASSKGDCNDSDAAINPGAQEVCDASDVDENCNGTADDADSTTAQSSKNPYYPDSDGDAFGSSSATATYACSAPTGYVSNREDCNDQSRAYNPNAAETSCTDPNDYNCDGSTGYSDKDRDGYAACQDCDDQNPYVHPSAVEICDSADVDEDCDGKADDADPSVSTSNATRFYPDQDGDGYGKLGDPGKLACDAPSGYSTNSVDCDDTRADVNPGATEICDGRNADENCNGVADNQDSTASLGSKSAFYHDVDTDGYGDAGSMTYACDNPTSSVDWWTSNHQDCDDRDPTVHPNAVETCDGQDNDCDGEADEGDAVDAALYYADQDGDGYGITSERLFACKAPVGYTTVSGDCNDQSAAISPAALEVCDVSDTDENCNGVADDDDSGTKSSTKQRYYADLDNDGYGRSTDPGTLFCDAPSGYVTRSGDCNDNNAAYNPEAQETCSDTNDYNCDGSVAYTDADQDSYAACQECDDHDKDVRPNATEVCDGKDNDCDGLIDDEDSSTAGSSKTRYYPDADGDGFGDGSASGTFCSDPSSSSLHWLTTSGDCDDSDDSISPSAQEVCNGVDDNCDTLVDPSSAVDAQTFYADEDEDLYGNLLMGTRACSQPQGTVLNYDDCNDSDEAINPLASEVCSSGKDMNCNGLIGCSDPACSNGSSCASAEVCTNGVDDDGDGRSDCHDSDCAAHPNCSDGCPDGDLGSATGTPVLYTTTSNATNDFESACGGASASDLSLTWTAPATATYRISTEGSSFDTVLSVLEGGCGGAPVACSDDVSSTQRSSELYLEVQEGQMLLLVLDGFGEASGDVTLTLEATEAAQCGDGRDNDGDGLVDCLDSDCASQGACLTEVCTDGIDNDLDNAVDCVDSDCAQASTCQGVSCPEGDIGSTVPATWTGSTLGLGNDLSAPCGGSSAEDVSVSFTAPATGTYTFSTFGSSFDTVLYALDGSCDGAVLACNDDASSGQLHSAFAVSLSSNERIVLVIDGFNQAAVGDFFLSVTRSEAGACADGQDNDGDGQSDCQDSDCATDSSCLLEDCSNEVDDDHDGLADCTDEDCAADSSCQDITCPDFSLGSTVGPAVASGSTLGLTNDYASDLCGAGGEAPDATFEWTSPATGAYQIDTFGSDFDTLLTLLGAGCGSSETACNDQYQATDQSGLLIYAPEGATGVFVLDGFGTAAGSYVLNITPSETLDCADNTDNDFDGLTDCDDYDCRNDLACAVEDCANGVDDDYDLHIDCGDTDCSNLSSCSSYTCPTRDLGSGLGDGVATGSTTSAGNELSGNCGGSVLGGQAPEVAFKWKAPATGSYRFDTEGSSFDTVLYVLDTSCQGSTLECNDQASGFYDYSELGLSLVADQVVILVVDGWAELSGSYVLNIHRAEIGECDDGLDNDLDGAVDCADPDCATDELCILEDCSNGFDDDYDMLTDCLDDECASADTCASFTCPDVSVGSSVGSALLVGSTVGMSNEFGSSCGGYYSGDIAISFTAPVDGYYTFDTFGSSFDTILSAYDGDCYGPFLACNDQAGNSDQSQLGGMLPEGYTLTLVIDGYGGAEGDYIFNVSYEGEEQPSPTPTPEPSYDISCADADLGSVLGSQIASGDTTGAGHFFESACAPGSSHELVFAWQAPTSALYTFDTQGSNLETAVSIYQLWPGQPCDEAMLITCGWTLPGDSGAVVAAGLGRGSQYLIVVEGVDGKTGDFVLNASISESAFCADGYDNDGDGLTDCADSDCAYDTACLVEDCTDGIDNDYDQAIDCRDPDCEGIGNCSSETCFDVDLGSTSTSRVYSADFSSKGNDFSPLCTSGQGNDVVLRWTAPWSGTFLMSSSGTEFAADLSLYQEYQGATSCLGYFLGCDVSFDSSDPAELSVWAYQGQVINVLLDDFLSTGGVGVLNIVPLDPPYATVTFDVTVPGTTPSGDSIYLTGSIQELGAWQPNAVAMTQIDDNRWTTTLILPLFTAFEYKYTRGSWDKVEKNADGSEMSNRIATTSYYLTLTDTVAAWADISIGGTHLVLNEIDYDNVGTDKNEFVEIYNPTTSSVSLADLALVFINGANGNEYRRVALSSASSLAPGGYLVVASSTVSVAPTAQVIRFSNAQDNIENGSPDGVALIKVSTGELVDALSYEGAITQGKVTVGSSTVTVNLVEGTAFSTFDSNTAEGGFIRYPNGADADNAATDWAFTTTVTPGTANALN